MEKLKLLVLCTGNSCRSQMAEGWVNYYWGKQIQVFSAGIEKHGVNPLAILAMKEHGIDIGHHYSKKIGDITEKNFDFVWTVCGHAEESCPHFGTSVKRAHVGFEDPPRLALKAKNAREKFSFYQQVCLEIKRAVKKLDTLLGIPLLRDHEATQRKQLSFVDR